MNNLATTLVQLGERQQAIEHFRRVLEIAPQHRGARENLQRTLSLSNGS